MNMKFSKTNNQDGFATLIALIMVGMMTLIGLAALSTSDDEISIAGNELQEMRAFYSAEAGLEIASAKIQDMWDSSGVPPTTMPSWSETINGCNVAFVTVDNGPPTDQTIATGTLAGLRAMIKTYSMISTSQAPNDPAKIELSQSFEAASVPLFQFAVFYENDLEIAPGPNMWLMGRVHTNSDLYLQADNTLNIDSYVTAAGNLLHGRKGPGGIGNGDIQIKDGSGNYVSMKMGSEFLESTDAFWYDSSVSKWNGRVQDAAHGQERLNMPLAAAGDPHKLIEQESGGNTDSYESLATLKFINNKAYEKVGGVWNNVTADMVAKGIIDFTNNTFTDAREGVQVDALELDIALLYAEGYGPANGVIYYSDIVGGGDPVLRVSNGSELDTALTIASENPVYVQGDYNSTNKKPASILADAVTFLSNSWADSASALALNFRMADNTTVNCSFLTGNVETTPGNYSGGLENLPRFLEKWNGKSFTWSGSMVNLWNSVIATGSWNGTYYSAPIRNWSYDTDLDDPANLPPETPVFRVYMRTGWAQGDVGFN